jgi:hypothetical protein
VLPGSRAESQIDAHRLRDLQEAAQTLLQGPVSAQARAGWGAACPALTRARAAAGRGGGGHGLAAWLVR